MSTPHSKEAKPRIFSFYYRHISSIAIQVLQLISYSGCQVLVSKVTHTLLMFRRTLENSLSHRSFFFTKIGPEISELSFKYCW